MRLSAVMKRPTQPAMRMGWRSVCSKAGAWRSGVRAERVSGALKSTMRAAWEGVAG